MIKTIKLTAGEEMAVELTGGVHARIENRGTGIVYASKSDNVTAGDDGVTAVSSCGTKYLKNACSYANYEGNFGYKGIVYLKSSEDGIVEIETGDYFFDSVNKSEGGGSSPVDSYTKAEIDTFLAGKVNVKNGYSLVEDSEITRLANVDNYDDSALQSKVAENSETLGYIKSKNLIENTYIGQVGSTGIITNISYDLNVVKVEESKTYVLSNTKDNGINVIAFFTSYPNVGSVSYNQSRIVSNDDYFTVPTGNGIKYMTVRSTLGSTKAQVEEGTIPTPYQPYKPNVDERINTLLSQVAENEVTLGYSTLRNLFDYSKRVDNTELMGNGKINSNNDWWASYYVPVEPNTTYKISGTSSNYTEQYDENKNFIQGSPKRTFTFTTLSNARYIRFNNCKTEDSGENAMIRPASITDDTYEPYKGSVDERLNKITNDKRLNNGDDLNNIIDVGRYSARDYTIAQSILNSPISQASMKPFCLDVYTAEYSTGKVVIQKLYFTNTFDGIIYMRVRKYDGSAWDSWYKFTGTAI